MGNTNTNAETVVILDFETTGLSPDQGDRAIEIGAVLIENGKMKDRFQELMNPGRKINSFIESYTGITNAMLENARPCNAVMKSFSEFIGGHNLVAHNAAFDKRFLDAELAALSILYPGKFACSLLAARRLYPDAPNHQLGTLIRYKNIPSDGEFHRALFDSEVTTKLWLRMLEDIRDQYNIDSIPFSLMQKLNKTPKKSVMKFMANWKNNHDKDR